VVTTGPGPGALHGLYVEHSQSETGPGAPLVACVHGSMDRHASFVRLRARLAPTCDVLLYDRRGYAASRDAVPPATGMDDHVADLFGLLEGRRAVLFGHSYGGDVALALAERHPEVVAAAVIFEAPLPWLDLWHAPGTASDHLSWAAATPEESAERFLRRMMGDRRYERIPAATRTELRKDGPALMTELTAIRRDPPPFDPGRIDVPVIVSWGGETVERHRRGAQWLAASLPRARKHMIEGAAHNGHRTHSKQIAELVLSAVALAASEPAQPRVAT
jgi:pimeloyl-ACP methyl ester carboxylesterase